MGTRSLIGIVGANGNVNFVYCHWDGYPEYNGALLVNNYKEEDKIKKLMAMGDISSMGIDTITFEEWQQEKFESKYGSPIIPKDPITGFPLYALSYNNWRNEGTESQTVPLYQYLNPKFYQDAEFKYYYHEGKWYCMDCEGNYQNLKRYEYMGAK